MKVKQAIKRVLPIEATDALRIKKQKYEIAHNKKLNAIQRVDALGAWFKSQTGEDLCLDKPLTFNQKTQWMKLNDSSREKGRLADKYLVREYVENLVGPDVLVPLLGVYNEPGEIDFSALPHSFVLKATHGSGWNIVVKNKDLLDEKKAVRKLKDWLEMDFAFLNGFELHYHYCQPRIVAEEYLDDIASKSLDDYKVYHFNNGEPVILVCRNRFSEGGMQTAYYDKRWNKLPFTDACEETFECPRPPHLEQMVEYSSRLAAQFAFVRVDWYESSRGLLFGEMTFTSGSGTENLEPSEWNRILGDRIDLSRIQ